MITTIDHRFEPNIFTWAFLVYFMKYLNNDFSINKDNTYSLAKENQVFHLNGKLHVIIHEKYVKNVIKNSRISSLSKFCNYYYFKVEESEYYDYINKSFSNELLLTMGKDDAYKLSSTNPFVTEMIKLYSDGGLNHSIYQSNGCISKYKGDSDHSEYGRYYDKVDRSEKFLNRFMQIPQYSTLHNLRFITK